MAKRKLDVPFGTKISSITNEGIEFYWKKLENTDGYEIYRAYKKSGPFELIAKIENRRKGTYIDNEFDHSKKSVFYSIKSYVVNDDGSVDYSELIAPKEAEYRKKIEIERDATYMYSGTQRSIKALYKWGEPSNVKWSSSDESVATVSNDGVITAVSSGECELTCKKSMWQKAKTKVVVDRKALEPLAPITSRYYFDESDRIWKQNAAEKDNEAIILMVGDLMCGATQMTNQCKKDVGWCFNDSYDYIKDVISSSDLSVANLETLLASGWPYMTDERYINNQNNCNATSRYLDAVKYAGFDLVTMSNNHNCDGGVRALLETIEQVDKYKLIRTGAYLFEDTDRYVIVDVNGIKVGYLAYTSAATGYNKKDATWSKKEKDQLLNTFSFEKAKKDIEDCKKAGAEYIIAYMHWGLKNYISTTDDQEREALEIANAGADYIVGANPHVLQKYDVITTDSGKEVPCFFSTGNFQSIMNQIPENRDSVIVRIKLTKDDQGNIILDENGYIPCHTYRKHKNSNWIPLALCDRYYLNIKKKNRIEFLDRIKSTIGDKIEIY